MKIALFHNSPGGGATRVICEYGKRLLRRGHQLDMYFPGQFAQKYEVLAREGAGMIACKAPSHEKRLEIRPYLLQVWAETLVHAWTAAVYNVQSRRLAQQIDRRGYDVVWVEKCRFASSPFVLRHLKTPTLYYCQEPWRDGYEGAVHDAVPPSAGFLRRLTTQLTRAAQDFRLRHHKNFDRSNACASAHVLANSEYSRGYIREAYGLESDVCYLGVDTEVFRPLGLARENFVLSVGRLEKRKRHELVIEAAGRIAPEIRPQVRIVAEWDAPQRRAALEKLAREKAVTLHFHFAVSDEELLRLYNQAAVVMYCAVREPFGLAAVEAMACGTPVIGVTEGGLMESIVDGKTGYLARPEPADCARALESLLKDPGLRERMGRAGIEHVRSFWTWDHAVDRFEARLQAAAGKPLSRESAPQGRVYA